MGGAHAHGVVDEVVDVGALVVAVVRGKGRADDRHRAAQVEDCAAEALPAVRAAAAGREVRGQGRGADDEDALHVEDRSTHSGAAAADVSGRSAVAATETTGARWSWAAAAAAAEAASTAVPACTRTRAASAKAAAGTVVVAATATAADTATAIRTAGTEVTAAAARDI